jgi:prolipoprotein diacylglyceryltransferase
MSPTIAGVRAYLACQVAAILLAIAITLGLARADDRSLSRVLAALLVLVSAAVVGAMLTAPDFQPTGGLRYPGAGIAALVVLPLLPRILAGSISLLGLGDLVAPALAFGMAVGKVGCFLHGCCHGWPSHLPWAVAFPRYSISWFDQLQAGLIEPAAERSLPVHPLQLYSAVWLIGVGMLVLSARSRKAPEGQRLLQTLSLYAAGLFVNDRFKVPPDPQVELCALLMLLVFAAGLLVLTARGNGTRVVRLVIRRR